MLTITSKVMRNLIEGYRQTSPMGQHLLPNPPPHTTITVELETEYVNKFHKLGLLVKRSTCLFTTRDRLKFINDFLTKMMCCNLLTCSSSVSCLSWTCFGRFFHTVIAGWDDMECQKAFESICVHACVSKSLNSVLTNTPGLHSTVEYKLRGFYRRIFLDPIDSLNDRAFWLGRILKPLPMVHQARLLYLLYGPVQSDVIVWHEMCENTPSSTDQTTHHFGPLAAAIQVLHNHQSEWNEDDIISVIDEMTCCPEDWLAENVASLLLMSGDFIMTKALVSKAINGRVLELSGILASLTLVCIKNGLSQTYVVSLIHKLLEVMETTKERSHFLGCVAEMFKEVFLDLHEYSSADDGPDSELMYMVSAITDFTKKLLLYAYRDMLSNTSPL